MPISLRFCMADLTVYYPRWCFTLFDDYVKSKFLSRNKIFLFIILLCGLFLGGIHTSLPLFPCGKPSDP